ncbi:hypothetical protein, partial [Leptospira weilii]|uniref:hypothetical protein n=1 Tax=Leptospira weilii TaxID=28184 RepID=UPI001C40094F
MTAANIAFLLKRKLTEFQSAILSPITALSLAKTKIAESRTNITEETQKQSSFENKKQRNGIAYEIINI